MWLATRTRVDMAYTMHRLCSVVSSHPDRANRMVKCVLRYLKGSIDIGILFCNSEELGRMEDMQLTTLAGHCDPNTLVGYSDASFAPDGAKSHQGVILCVGMVPCFWKPCRQTIVSFSTAESELIADCDAFIASWGSVNSCTS